MTASTSRRLTAGAARVAGVPLPPRGATRRLPRLARATARAGGRGALHSTAILLFLGLWEIAPSHLLDPGTRAFLPPFHEVARAWWRLAEDGTLGEQTRASIVRSLAGFALAVLAAVPLGLLIGWYRPVSAFLTPLLEVFRNTAALALLPVFTLLIGIGEASKVAIVLYAAFFPILLNTIAGVRSVDPLLVRAARSLGIGQARLFARVVLPASLPTVFTGIRMGGAASILVLVAAEMVGAKAGLGIYIQSTQSSFLIPQMYAGILTISVLGVAANYGLVRLERRFSRWRVDPSPHT